MSNEEGTLDRRERAHAVPPFSESCYEVLSLGHITVDPKTAHSAVGDPDWRLRLLTCHQCEAQALAYAESGKPIPEEGAPW